MLPCGHTGVALRGWSHPHRSPTDTPLSFLSRYGSTLAELNSALTPRSAGWCVRKSYRQVDPLGFRLGRAHILHAQVKPQHLGSENRNSRGTLRSAPLSPIPDRLFRAHPAKVPKTPSPAGFTPHTPRTTIPNPTHALRSSVYVHAHIDIYIVVGQSRTG
jgi:hypothetical protein